MVLLLVSLQEPSSSRPALINFSMFKKKVAATALYNEGAVMVIHAVMINCKLMLERSSNIYGQYSLPC